MSEQWDQWSTYAALYAAIVATGALFLEIRRWFESGPRLRLRVMAEANLLSGGKKDPRDFLFLWVTNTGSAPTTITHMVLHKYRNAFQFWRRHQYESAFVPMPEVTGGSRLPTSLGPGSIWSGVAEYDDNLREMASTGDLYVGVSCSHRDREYLKRVRLKGARGTNSGVTIPN